MYPDSQNRAQQAAQGTKIRPDLPMPSYGGLDAQKSTRAYRPSLAEESAKSEQYHAAEGLKASMAAAFLSANPAFDEFIQLIRAGAIHI